MKIKNVSVAYFSATYTTQKIVRQIAQSIKPSFTEYDITRKSVCENIYLDTNDLLIVAVPVYAGRVPLKAAKALDYFKGNDTPIILVAVYGNRAYEDALVELKDLVEHNFFKPISAGVFIGRHSIFHPIAMNRPNGEDLELATAFAKESSLILEKIKKTDSIASMDLPGDHPYKPYGQFPIYPTTNSDICNKCGKCSLLCPVKAISKTTPDHTDQVRCLSCGRCIIICPKDARSFSGELYDEKLEYFLEYFAKPNKPEFFYATVE